MRLRLPVNSSPAAGAAKQTRPARGIPVVPPDGWQGSTAAEFREALAPISNLPRAAFLTGVESKWAMVRTY